MNLHDTGTCPSTIENTNGDTTSGYVILSINNSNLTSGYNESTGYYEDWPDDILQVGMCLSD